MGKKPVKFSFDPSNLPPLTAMQHDELAALAKMQDDRIDTSDIAPLGDAFWKGALSNPFYKPTKKVTTVRIDADVLLWLKSTDIRTPAFWSTRDVACTRCSAFWGIPRSRLHSFTRT